MLTITVWDSPDLSGKFTVETDGSFTFPLIGRVKAGGLTLRQFEARAQEEAGRRLLQEPAGERRGRVLPQPAHLHRRRGAQPRHVPAHRRHDAHRGHRAGRLDDARRQPRGHRRPRAGRQAGRRPDAARAEGRRRRDRSASTSGICRAACSSQNIALRDGDTIFVPRAESIYVFGQVKNPGAYALQSAETTVLQALSLAGGVTDRGATNRIKIVRVVNGEKKEIKVKLRDLVLPGDTIIVPEKYF